MREPQDESPQPDAKRDHPPEENQIEQQGRQSECGLWRNVSTSLDANPKTAEGTLMKVERPRDDEEKPQRRCGKPKPNSHSPQIVLRHHGWR